VVVTLKGNPCFIAVPSKGLKRFLFSCMREMNKKVIGFYPIMFALMVSRI
jgi:hypothetical protein